MNLVGLNFQKLNQRSTCQEIILDISINHTSFFSNSSQILIVEYENNFVVCLLADRWGYNEKNRKIILIK